MLNDYLGLRCHTDHRVDRPDAPSCHPDRCIAMVEVGSGHCCRLIAGDLAVLPAMDGYRNAHAGWREHLHACLFAGSGKCRTLVVQSGVGRITLG